MSPLMTCCSSTARLAMLDIAQCLGRPIDQLIEETLRAAERRLAEVAEKKSVHPSDLRHQAIGPAAPGRREREEDAARVARIGALREQPAVDEPLRLSGDEGARDAKVARERAHGDAVPALQVRDRDQEHV